MTPLLGTKNPSALVGAKSGGDGRAARSLLSCVLWRGMGRLWRGMGGGRPPHRQHGLSGFHETRDTAFFRITTFTAVRFSVGARGVASPETALRTTASAGKSLFSSSPLFTIVFTNHSFPAHDFPPFPTISRHFPAPPPPSADQVSTRRLPFLVSRPGLPPPPGRCFPARCGAAWGGYGAAWAAAVARTGNTAFPVRRPSDISSGANQAPQPWFSRNTAFSRMLRPLGGEKCRLAAGARPATMTPTGFASNLRRLALRVNRQRSIHRVREYAAVVPAPRLWPPSLATCIADSPGATTVAFKLGRFTRTPGERSMAGRFVSGMQL